MNEPLTPQEIGAFIRFCLACAAILWLLSDMLFDPDTGMKWFRRRNRQNTRVQADLDPPDSEV